MDKRVFLWALAGWLTFGLLGALALLGQQAPVHQLAVGFLIPGVFGLMVGGMLGLVRRLKANQRELGRFLLTVIGGTVVLGSVLTQLCHAFGWPAWVAALGADLGGIAGLVLSQRQFRAPLAPAEAGLMLAAMTILGYDSFGLLIVPILVVSAVALNYHLKKSRQC